jgi:integrase
MDREWHKAFRQWRTKLKEDWSEDATQFASSLGVVRENFSPDRYRRFLDEEVQATLNDAFLDGKDMPEEQLDSAIQYLTWDLSDEEFEQLDNPLPPDVKQVSGSDTIMGCLTAYIDGRNWNRQKSKDAAKRQIERFVEVIGNIKLDLLEKSHAYDYAQALSDQGYAHKTIRSSVSAVSAMLDWSERTRLIKMSPFVNLKLASYGKEAKSYRPFEKEELHSLFRQDMSEQEHLLLSILISTGMRLDEAALMTWERIKEIDHIRCFSLLGQGSEEVIVKNSQSNRLIALPDCLELPKRSAGRMFEYRLDKDGKAENAASKALMKIIRKVTGDDRKVVHSLRGTLKDLLRDAGVTKEVNDFITGHSQGDEAGKYGSGPSLETKYRAVNAVDHPWLR